MDNVKRVLHVVSSMNRGGAETMIMNLYRNMDRNKIQFDFVCHSEKKCDYEDEIISLGGRIFRIKSLGQGGILSYIKNLGKVISKYGPFIAVHAHTDIQAGLVTLIAQIYGIKIRICHSHNTKWKEKPSIKDNIMSYLLRSVGRITANKYCACGNEAANFFFGKRITKNGKVEIFKNGIEVEKFNNISIDDIKLVKKSINANENTIIIGHIGRFYEQKNHQFIIEVGKKLEQLKVDYKIILVGDGPRKGFIEDCVKKEGLDKNIIFLGVRNDIPILMNVFDKFIFPSYYEGLPLVLIEAQAAGIEAVVSDTITREADLGLNLIKYVKLNSSIDNWIKNIINNKKIINSNEKILAINSKGYNVKNNIIELNNLYEL